MLTKFYKIEQNDKKHKNSQNQTDLRIKTNSKNKYKTLQVTEITNGVGKL